MAVRCAPEPAMDAAPRLRALDGRDRVVFAAIVAGTLAYLARWPNDLYHWDEGLYLFEAKRILGGDVLYRDIFEIVTPGAWYLMALVFAIFGVGMTVARLTMAVLHALIAATVYVACRRTGVRRSLSGLAVFAYPALCFPALPIATPHWFATGLTLLLLVGFLGEPRRHTPWGAGAGALAGALILVQQQKGVIIAVGVLCTYAAYRAVAARSVSRLGTFSPRRFVTGMLAVSVPVLLAFAIVAGPGAVFTDLVVHPLFYYRGSAYNHSPWGQESVPPHTTVYPWVIGFLPVTIPLAILSLVVSRRRPTRAAGNTLVLTGFTVFSVLAVLYNPDITHLVLFAPVWLVLAAALVEAALSRLGSRLVDPIVTGLAVLLAARLAIGMNDNLKARRRQYPFSAETPFGRVAFTDDQQLRTSRIVRDLARRDGVEEIFVYPYYPSLYLLSETRNATRYQTLIPGYNTDGEIQEVIQDLERKKVRYVVVGVALFWSYQQDALMAYLREHYDRVPLGLGGPGRMPAFMLFSRRAASPSSD